MTQSHVGDVFGLDTMLLSETRLTILQGQEEGGKPSPRFRRRASFATPSSGDTPQRPVRS